MTLKIFDNILYCRSNGKSLKKMYTWVINLSNSKKNTIFFFPKTYCYLYRLIKKNISSRYVKEIFSKTLMFSENI